MTDDRERVDSDTNEKHEDAGCRPPPPPPDKQGTYRGYRVPPPPIEKSDVDQTTESNDSE